MLSPLPEPDRASSPVTGVILLICITVILAMLVLLLCLGFHLPSADSSVPVIFRIATITYISDSDGTSVRGYVTVTNTQSENYRNRFLKVVTYVNGTMAYWNTVFVEVPLITFNPVKQITDLLREAHMP